MNYSCKILVLYFLFAHLFSCVEKQPNFTQGFRKLAYDEMVERARNSDFPKEGTFQYMSASGQNITIDSFYNIEPEKFDKLGFDDYVDSDGVIRIIVVRPATTADVDFLIAEEKAIAEGPILASHKVNCDSIVPLLKRIELDDQSIRRTGATYDPAVDKRNLEYVISIIESCREVVEFGDYSASIIWLVLQHARLKYQQEYFPLLTEMAEEGKIDHRDLYMMQDRMLISEDKPQIYGTQICDDRNGGKKLCDVVDLANLDKRRIAAGFDSINVYLANWGIKIE